MRMARPGVTRAKRKRNPNRYGGEVRSSSVTASAWSPATSNDTARKPWTSSLMDRGRLFICTRTPSRRPGLIGQIARRPSGSHPPCERASRRPSRPTERPEQRRWYPWPRRPSSPRQEAGDRRQDPHRELTSRTPSLPRPGALSTAHRAPATRQQRRGADFTNPHDPKRAKRKRNTNPARSPRRCRWHCASDQMKEESKSEC